MNHSLTARLTFHTTLWSLFLKSMKSYILERKSAESNFKAAFFTKFTQAQFKFKLPTTMGPTLKD